MKTLRNFCTAATLIFMLSLPAMAGDIPTWVVAPSPPPPPPSVVATNLNEITTDDSQNATDSEPLLTAITLSVLRLLSVF